MSFQELQAICVSLYSVNDGFYKYPTKASDYIVWSCSVSLNPGPGQQLPLPVTDIFPMRTGQLDNIAERFHPEEQCGSGERSLCSNFWGQNGPKSAAHQGASWNPSWLLSHSAGVMATRLLLFCNNVLRVSSPICGLSARPLRRFFYHGP
ncbi:unnamed protein product [Pleuronectes platessa]|uniref:Uncharacterized protein n=1 Tax=Pleuronectes platessa TaxID=8262 RepID=A0A9N7VRQ2_PLEPL|nr:unnamed protein product [Pleuronectes platessa]